MNPSKRDSERTTGQRNAYWRASDAQQVLDHWNRSGMTLTAFARSRGLRRRRLEYWRDRLAKPAKTSGPKFHRVHLTDSSHQGRVDSEVIEIVTARGYRVVVRPGFDGGFLAEVVRVLEALPC